MTSPQPTQRQLTVRFPVEVFEQIETLAEQEQRSLANTVRLITTRYLSELYACDPSKTPLH